MVGTLEARKGWSKQPAKWHNNEVNSKMLREQRGSLGDHFSLGYRSILDIGNCRPEKMGFMISFDGRATLTSDERHSPERYRTNGRTIDTFSRKNTVNARYL